MKLIDIEGIDGTGKYSQSKLLTERLIDMGYAVLWLSFPSKASTASTICIDSQFGKYGDPNEKSPYALSMMYALDRYLFINNSVKDIESYDYVVCDRYRMSNIINNLHKIGDKYSYIKTLSKMEDSIPKERFSFVLDLPVEIVMRQMSTRDELDLWENEKSQVNFRKNIRWIKNNTDFISKTMNPCGNYEIHVIPCYENGETLSIGTINNTLLSYIIQE